MILKNTLVLLAAQVISMGLGIVFTIYMARYLGVQGFGLLSFALAFASAFAIFGDFGLSTLMTREIARDKLLAGKYLGNAITVKLFLVIATFVLIVLAVNLLGYPEQMAQIIYLIALSIIFTTFTQTFYAMFQAYEKMEYQSFGAILSSALMLAGALAVIWWGKGVVEFALTYFVANAIVLAYSLWVCSWKIARPGIRFDKNFSRLMLISAFPFGLSLAAGMIYGNIDAILLSAMKGYEAVGWYSAAYRLVLVLAVIPGMINLAIFPAMSRFHVTSKKSLELLAEKYFKLMMILGLPIGVGTLLLSDKIILLIFGAGFQQSSVALRILVWATIFTFIGAAYIQLCGSTNKQMQVAKITIVCMVINVAANLLLIPEFSFVGSSIARLVSEIFLVSSVLYMVNRVGYNIFTRDVLLTAAKAAFACLIMSGFIIVFNGLGSILLILASSGLYFLALFIIGGIDQEYVDLFKGIIFGRYVINK